MAKQRKLPVIRDDIVTLRRWIRRAEDDGVNWRKVRRAKDRLAELEAEEARAMKKAATVKVVPPEDPSHDSRGEPRVRVAPDDLGPAAA